MNEEIKQLLLQYGWVFAGVSQPDHRRQWARIQTDEDGKFVKIARLEDEDNLVELANQIIG